MCEKYPYINANSKRGTRTSIVTTPPPLYIKTPTPQSIGRGGYKLGTPPFKGDGMRYAALSPKTTNSKRTTESPVILTLLKNNTRNTALKACITTDLSTFIVTPGLRTYTSTLDYTRGISKTPIAPPQRVE